MFSRIIFRRKLYVMVVLLLTLSTISGVRSRVYAQGDPAVTEYAIPTDLSKPFGITAGPDGAMWFAEGDGNKIGRIGMDGKITEFAIPTAESNPGLLTSGSDGAIWFVERDGNKIGRLTMEGQFSEFAIPSGGEQVQTASGKTITTSTPQGIVRGPDNALWFTEQAGNKIGRITTDGTITEYPLPTADSGPLSILLGGDNQLWFTERSGNRIGSISADGKIAEYTIPTADAGPTRLAVGSEGDLWFCEFGASQIGRITTDGTITEYPVPGVGPVGIARGADNAMWFTEWAGNKIGKISDDGQVTEYPVPTETSNPILVALGPDGALWFTEWAGNKIGRLPTGPVSPVTFAWENDGGANRLGRPTQIAVDSQNNVYVVDSNNARIQKFDPNGTFLLMWGSQGAGEGQFAFRAGSELTSAIAVDDQDKVYVVDYSGRVQEFDSSGHYLGLWNTLHTSATQATLGPHSMVIDHQGNLYISYDLTGTTNQVDKYDPQGHLLAWGRDSLPKDSELMGLAVDAQDNLYAADDRSNLVYKFDSTGKLLSTWGGTGAGEGQFHGASGIAVDGQGNVYVGDNQGNRVEEFDPSGTFLGQWDTKGNVKYPEYFLAGVALDHSGNIYITELSNGDHEYLKKYSPS
jgi:virginiamycin B lyase